MEVASVRFCLTHGASGGERRTMVCRTSDSNPSSVGRRGDERQTSLKHGDGGRKTHGDGGGEWMAMWPPLVFAQ